MNSKLKFLIPSKTLEVYWIYNVGIACLNVSFVDTFFG